MTSPWVMLYLRSCLRNICFDVLEYLSRFNSCFNSLKHELWYKEQSFNAVNSVNRGVHCGQNGSFQIAKSVGTRRLILSLERLNDVYI